MKAIISDLTALSLESCIDLFTIAYLFDPVFSFTPPKRKTWFGEEPGSCMIADLIYGAEKSTLSLVGWGRRGKSIVFYLQPLAAAPGWKTLCRGAAIDRTLSAWKYTQPQEVWNTSLSLCSRFPCHRFCCHSTQGVLLALCCVASAALYLPNLCRSSHNAPLKRQRKPNSIKTHACLLTSQTLFRPVPSLDKISLYVTPTGSCFEYLLPSIWGFFFIILRQGLLCPKLALNLPP